MIEGETIFRSSSDETERRQLFDEYIVELRKTQQEREHQTRKEALEELVSLLKSLDLEPYTRWSEAQAIIRHEHFQSEEKFQALSKLDVLNAFENHIKVLERSFNDKRQKVKNMKMRKERKNREAFSVCPPLEIHDCPLLPCEFANCFFFCKGLLSHLRTKGEIHVGTKWKHIHPLLKNDERYLNMLGQPGSTPLDLFWDTMEEVERDIRMKRNFVMDILAVSPLPVKPQAEATLMTGHIGETI